MSFLPCQLDTLKAVSAVPGSDAKVGPVDSAISLLLILYLIRFHSKIAEIMMSL